MALLEKISQPKAWNLNSILHLIAIGALVWVGQTVTSSKDRLAKIDERLAVIDATNNTKMEQLNRIEIEVSKQRDALHDLQMDVSRLKGK